MTGNPGIEYCSAGANGDFTRVFSFAYPLTSVGSARGVLLGDTVVNSADITQTRRQSGNVTNPLNFREDVTLDGVINNATITLARRQSGTALP